MEGGPKLGGFALQDGLRGLFRLAGAWREKGREVFVQGCFGIKLRQLIMSQRKL